MNDIRYTSATDGEILQELGRRLVALRKTRGLTQADAADRAGMSRNTLYRAERGDNPTLHTVVRLLRAYGRLPAMEAFIPPVEISPMRRLKERRGDQGA